MNPVRHRTMALAFLVVFTVAARHEAGAEPPAAPWVRISPLDHEYLTVQLSTVPPALDPGYRALLESERQFFKRGQASLPALVSAYNQFGVVHVEFTSAQARADFETERVPGVSVFSRTDRFADLFIESVEALATIEQHAAIRWVDLGTVSKIPNPGIMVRQLTEPGGDDGAVPVRGPSANAPEVVIRSGDPRVGGLTGKGVVIVIIDTGIDFRDPDFIVGDPPTSRVLYYWDTLVYLNPKFATGAELPPISAPNGLPLGIVYTQEGLTKDLRDRSRAVPLYDVHGHGTCCAGVAAGNGRNARGNPAAEGIVDPGLGAAAEANLIVVRIAWTDQLQYEFLLGAIIDWVEQKARTDERMKDKPIVYSCSWGSCSGDRAGNQGLERQLDARFPASKVGRAICIAAGNDGRSAHHGRPFADGNAQRLVWDVHPSAAQAAREGHALTIYYGGVGDKSDLDVEYVPPDSIAGDEREQLKAAALKDFDSKTFRHGVLGTLVTDVRWRFPAGRNELRFTPKSGATLRPEDAYLSPPGGAKAEFADGSRDYGKQIGFPAAAAAAITVGSYDWNPRAFDARKRLVEVPLTVGELSGYSNPGPVRLGDSVKPDIVAPGQYWLVSEADPRLLDAPRKYGSFNGTSAATPYVAGVVALMLQKKPTLTAGEIKQLVATHATKDAETLLPKDRRVGWGNGKLDSDAVERIVQAVK